LIYPVILFVVGYAVIMGPWMLRNMSIWGTPLTPAGNRALWLTRYDDTFAWPPDRVNMQNWLAAGWNSAIAGRLEALKLNSINTIAAQAGILLFPFILVGLWKLRKDLRIRIAVLAWLALYFVMCIIFPFAGSRGSFFHAGAALQPVWFTSAVVGVDVLVTKARARGWFTPAAPRLFRAALIMFMAALTVGLVYVSIFQNDWNQFHRAYIKVEQMLVKNGAQPSDVVIVANAPGYFAANGRSAIIVPDENLESVRALAHQFNAHFLVLEKTYYTDPMIPVYQNPESQPGLTYLGEFDEIRIFAIKP
jgi:flagellar biosynthesis protein FliQ